MSNPGGDNQFGNYTLQPGYGDVKRQTELLREAPISGSPLAAQALQAPRRAQKAASRRPGTNVGSPPLVAPQAPPEASGPSPDVYHQIAAIPGASPLVQLIFGNA